MDLELGGKSANIITATENLDDALDGALNSIYTNNGQQRFAGSRILLGRTIAEDFIRRFVQRAKAIRVADPLADAAHYARVCSSVEIPKKEGGQLLCGGKRPENVTERG